uniref:F-box domain-containing protein n=1 Tax=Culex tarsalis TaxID=7177 RepID=A0A1Q3EW38_CULTA
MESCDICGQLLENRINDVPCSGPCGGTVHASCASASGVRLANADVGMFWFCDQCRRGLRSLTKNKQAVALGAAAADSPELPTEVWIEVFRNLSCNELLKMRQVCRRWRDIVTGCPALMGKLTVTFRKRKVDPDYLLPVRKASFKAINRIEPWWQSFGQNVVEIKIQRCDYEADVRIKFEHVLEILQQAPNLQRFELIGCTLIDKHSAGVDFRLEKLETLVLDNISNHEGRLKVFRELCPNVKSLKFLWEDDETVVDSLEVAEFVQRAQNSLEELEVYCSKQFLAEMLKFERLKLKKLTAHEPLEVEALVEDDRKLLELFRMHPTLEYLDIREIVTFNDSDGMMLNELGQLLQELKFLSICASHVDLSFLLPIVKLQTLNLFGEGKRFATIHSSASGERHSNLRELHLSRAHLPDIGLLSLNTALPNLRVLSLTGCKIGKWSAFLEALCDLALLQHLTLDISKVDETTRSFFSPKALTSLKYLAYTKRNKTTNEMLIELVTMCPGLQELKLRNVELGEAILGAIFLNLTQMTKFTTSGCDAKGVLASYIRQNCCALEELVGMES